MTTYLNTRGLEISIDKSAAIAFTRRRMDKYPLKIGKRTIPYVKCHTFLGITIDRGLTWSPHILYLRKKLASFSVLARFIGGTTWGATVRSLLQIYVALFVGLLRYSAPILHGTCQTNIKALRAVQARGLRGCLGLPACASTLGTVAEARATPVEILMMPETLRVHLRHTTNHSHHLLADLTFKRPHSEYSMALSKMEHYIPDDINSFNLPTIPPWRLPFPVVELDIQGIKKKSNTPLLVLKQLTLSTIACLHASKTHIYTDGSCVKNSSTANIVIPSDATRKFKLSQKTSSTAAELVGLHQALRFILTKPPQAWTVFTDSKPALQSICTYLRRSENGQIIFKLLCHLQKCIDRRHSVDFQWIPGHCKIPGNEAADGAATSAHTLFPNVEIPYSRSDITSLINLHARNATQSLWKSSAHHYPPLYLLDPDLTYRVSRNLPKRTEAVIHRLPLGVSYTQDFLHRIGKTHTPNCPGCDCVETISHLLCECALYDAERELLKRILSHLDYRPFTTSKILGAWDSPLKEEKAAKALVRFLSATRLEFCL
ncbi:uncharacterized protein LOC120836973 [Ixodes scapularis]|uniref:uncharacterized protein LOC120836973 n=1 Tax=Ixodes scapularis TaxID=6945 RepID=UPI001A9E3B22|nr:uncharacterized protein LOC120836973 [Ixodes scapularis]